MPEIDVPTLQKHIKSRSLEPVYLLMGDDVKLIEQLVDQIESTIDEGDRPFAVDRLYAAEAGGSPIDITASANGLPMLGDRRLVIVLRAERLLKPKRAGKASAEDASDEDSADPSAEPSANDTTPLEEYVKAPCVSTTLVFVATEIDKSRRLTKRVIEKAKVLECGGLNARDPSGRREARSVATTWVRDELTRGGKTIDQAALTLLVDRSGFDITRLRGDVERLLLYTEGRKKISVEDVDEVASTQVTVDDDWAVVNAIGDGDPARALRAASQRLERGDSPHALVGQLRWWVSTKLAAGEPSRVKSAIDALLRADLALKSSGGDQRVLIERLVVELTGRPVAQTGWRR